MATIAQINANIGNSKFSTGPLSPEGKQASSRNGLRHGLYASYETLRTEDKRQVADIIAHFSEQFPQAEAELLLHELALAWFRRDRVRGMEAGFLDIQLEMARKQCPEPHVTRDHLLASILIGDSNNKRILDKLHRWDLAFTRDIDRALKLLKEIAQPAETEIAETKPLPSATPDSPSRNSPCSCGSGLKYKRCCGRIARIKTKHSDYVCCAPPRPAI
jgi:hypothetical protein